MNFAVEAILLSLSGAVALIALRDAHKDASRVHEWLTSLAVKAIGAAAGATLAAWWRQPARWLLQIVGGTWMGMTSAGWLIDYFEWPATPDYLLMSGSIAGLCGYSLLEGILKTAPVLLRAIRAFVTARVGAKADES